MIANLVPGAVHELIPDPNLTTPVGNLVTIEAVHTTGPQQWVTVSAPVLHNEADIAPGERRLRLETWTVAASRIGRYVSGPPTPAQLEEMRRILRTLGNAADEPAACPVYDWCIERGDHDAHQGATIELASPSDRPGDGPYLGCYLLDGGSGPIAGLNAGTWLDLDAAGLRGEVKKIREHCALLDAMADQLAAIENEVAPITRPCGHDDDTTA